MLSDLLQALAIKKERGWNTTDLVEDLMEASLRIAESDDFGSAASNSKARKRPSGSVVVAEEVSLLWSALLLSWSHSFASDHIDPEQVDVVVEFEHLCRDFGERLRGLAGDPLSGCWSHLSDAFRAIADMDESEGVDRDPRADMLRSISRRG